MDSTDPLADDIPQQAQRAWADGRRIGIELLNGDVIFIAADRFPRLAEATDAQLAAVYLRLKGTALRWDDIDEDLTVRGVVRAANSGASILAIPRQQAPALPESACWAVADLDFFFPPQWRPRPALEHDEGFLQPIPYLALHNEAGDLWTYRRRGGDARVDGRCSCGVGGHVELQDAAASAGATLLNALKRETAEELGLPLAEVPIARPRALIYEHLSAIGRVHLGVLYTARWNRSSPPCPPDHEALEGLGFMKPETIVADPRFELWSRLVAGFLIQHP